MVEAEQLREQQYAHETGDNARNDARNHGLPMLLKQIELLIQRHGKADGCRCQQKTDGIGARGISLVAHPAQAQKGDDQDNRDQKRVQKRQASLLAQPYPYRIRRKADQHSKKCRIPYKLSHFRPPFLTII